MKNFFLLLLPGPFISSVLKSILCGILVFLIGCSSPKNDQPTSFVANGTNDTKWKEVKTFAQSIRSVTLFRNTDSDELSLIVYLFDFDRLGSDGAPWDLQISINLSNGSESSIQTNDRFSGTYACANKECDYGEITLKKSSGALAGEAKIHFIEIYDFKTQFEIKSNQEDTAIARAARAIEKNKSLPILTLIKVADGYLNRLELDLVYDFKENKPMPQEWQTLFFSNLSSNSIEVSQQTFVNEDLKTDVKYEAYGGSVTLIPNENVIVVDFSSALPMKRIRLQIPEEIKKNASRFFSEKEDPWKKDARFLCTDPELNVGIWPVFEVAYFKDLQRFVIEDGVGQNVGGCLRQIKRDNTKVINEGRPCEMREDFSISGGSAKMYVSTKFPERVVGEKKIQDGISYLSFASAQHFDYILGNGTKVFYGGEISHMCNRFIDSKPINEILIEFRNFRGEERTFARFRPLRN